MGTLQAGDALSKLLADPELAREALPLLDKAAKKANPAHQTVEEQAAPIVERALKQVDEKLAKRDSEAANRAAEDALAREIQAAYAEGFTEDGVKGVLEVMKRGVASFADAKKIYRSDHPTPDMSAANDSRMDWNFYEEIQGGDLKGFFDGSQFNAPSITANPEKWQRAAALAYLDGKVGLPTG